MLSYNSEFILEFNTKIKVTLLLHLRNNLGYITHRNTKSGYISITIYITSHNIVRQVDN